MPDTTPLTLAWRPFLDPLPLENHWLWLMIPLALAVALIYKAIKLPDLSQLPAQTLVLSSQIIAFMVLVAAALWILTEIA
ncbi:hypothetical protein [Mucisphaera calidilacus]|uniref:Uncharacterized protein n=1 Tax=Mucisphaera calidilacus TaxID=2527982 RepID=A0A518C1B6_9BACT|nr:hypothetical protein [Mucisphaera calidilacus]QDU73022.1 hypothetical protein Pan265_29000 [Mucisphaera calidilacus]